MSASTSDDNLFDKSPVEKKYEKRKKLSRSCAPERTLGLKKSKALKYDSEDDDSFSSSSENQLDDFIEVGPPKLLKIIEQIKDEEADKKTILEQEYQFPKSFYCKELKEYLLGDFKCEFCQSTTLPWPSFQNQTAYNSLESYCCNDYKEYCQGLLDHQICLEIMRKKMRFDFRKLEFIPKANPLFFTSKLDDLKLNDKLYTNSLLSTIASDKSKQNKTKNSEQKDKVKNEKGRNSKELKEKEKGRNSKELKDKEKGRNSKASKNSKKTNEEEVLEDEENGSLYLIYESIHF